MRYAEGKLYARGAKRQYYWRTRIDGKQQNIRLEGATSLTGAKKAKQAVIEKLHLDPDAMERKRGSTRVPVQEFWDKVKEHKLTTLNLRPTTLECDHQAFTRLVEYAKADHVGQITQGHIESFLSEMLTKGLRNRRTKKRKAVSLGTANRVLRHIKSVFSCGIENNFYHGTNPAQNVKQRKVTTKIPEICTRKQRDRILEVAKETGRDIYLVVTLVSYLGLRKNEAINAHWQNFDSERAVYRVKELGDFKTKDHEERQIPVVQKLYDIIGPYRQDSGPIFKDRRRAEDGRYRYAPDKEFNAVKKRADVPNATLQMLRRTFGSLLVQGGAPLLQVSRSLGHSSVRVTEKWYLGDIDDVKAFETL